MTTATVAALELNWNLTTHANGAVTDDLNGGMVIDGPTGFRGNPDDFIWAMGPNGPEPFSR